MLLKQQHPNWTPFDIRAALANTSVTLFNEDKIQGGRIVIHNLLPIKVLVKNRNLFNGFQQGWSLNRM
jgi:hypothetical protein